MGGRAAEEICLGQITTGAGNDIERATELARKMVCEWGMSDKMGPLTYGHKEEQVFLGRDFAAQKNFSDETAKLIDLEVKALVMNGYNKAVELLTGNREKLERVAQALLDRETLNLKEITNLMNGKDADYDDGKVEKEDRASPTAPAVSGKKKPGALGGADGIVGGGGYPDPSPA